VPLLISPGSGREERSAGYRRSCLEAKVPRVLLLRRARVIVRSGSGARRRVKAPRLGKAAADHTGVSSRRLLIAYSAAIVLLSWPATLAGATWWPWQPVRLVIASVAVVAWSRRAAVVAICAWALVAAPWTVRQAPAYFARSAVAPGERLATGVPSGPFVLRTERAPVGLTVLRAATKNYINGEGDYASSELVAWSATLLPWPHIDRTEIIGMGGNVIDFWASPSSVEVRRQRDRLLLAHNRYDDARGAEWPEVRPLGFGPSSSPITYLGWIAVLLSLAVRAIGRSRT
jgi:hypothetical protein